MLNSNLKNNNYDGIIIAVGHKKFKLRKSQRLKLCKKNHIIYDLKYLFSQKDISLSCDFVNQF